MPKTRFLFKTDGQTEFKNVGEAVKSLGFESTGFGTWAKDGKDYKFLSANVYQNKVLSVTMIRKNRKPIKITQLNRDLMPKTDKTGV